MNEDEMSGQKPRNAAEGRDLVVRSELWGQSWLSRPEALKLIAFSSLRREKRSRGTHHLLKIPTRPLPTGDPVALS